MRPIFMKVRALTRKGNLIQEVGAIKYSYPYMGVWSKVMGLPISCSNHCVSKACFEIADMGFALLGGPGYDNFVSWATASG